MSRENVEIARKAFEAFNRTFNEGAPDLYELLDPEIEWIPMTAILEGTTYHGHDEVRQSIKEMRREWTSYETRPECFRDLGDRGVLVLGKWRARGRRGDMPLDFPQAAWLLHYRKGKILRVQTFTHRDEALEAAGLRE